MHRPPRRRDRLTHALAHASSHRQTQRSVGSAPYGVASAAAIPAICSPPARHLAVQQALLQLSWRRPPCSMNKVAQSSLPRVLMVQPPFPVDNSPPCTIQVQQIVTSSGLKRWRSAGPIREVRRMDRMSFWLASSRWRGWQWSFEHPQQPRVSHIGLGRRGQRATSALGPIASIALV